MHGLGVAEVVHPCQLHHVEAKQPAEPAMVRQQSLRDGDDRDAGQADVRNRYIPLCCGLRQTTWWRWQRIEDL
jgi:hypothetical protein